MISIYHSAFNLIKHGFFKWENALINSCLFADEVVIAINTSVDETENKIKEVLSSFKNYKIINTSFSYDDPWLDPKVKNAALQECTQEFKIQLDLDEYIPIWQKEIWRNLCLNLKNDSCLCYGIPCVNLYKEYNRYFYICYKQYLHKEIAYRAPQRGARNPDGTINTTITDGCDLVDGDGDLVSTKTTPIDLELLESRDFPFIVHYGFLNLEARLKRNHEFWNKHWYIESGGSAPGCRIDMELKDFNYESKNHSLLL